MINDIKKYKTCRFRVVSCCLLALALLLLGQSSKSVTKVSGVDPRITYMGAWMSEGTSIYTVYGGSQFRIKFSGTVTLNMNPIYGRVKIRPVGSENGSVEEIKSHITLSSEQPVEYEVVYMAQHRRFFLPSSEGFYGARLTLNSVTVEQGSTLCQASLPGGDLTLEFLGDSITKASRILNGYGDYEHSMDASQGFAYLTAKKLDASYRIRGYGGLHLQQLTGMVPYFLYGIPFEPAPEPDFVIINIGANNTYMTDSVFEECYTELLDSVFGVFPGSSVILLNFFEYKGLQGDGIDRRDSLKNLCSMAPDRIMFFNAEPWLTGYTDEVHPDVAAHAGLAEALASFIASVSISQ